MGDLNEHLGLVETVKQIRQLILDFADIGMRIENWELEHPVTWRSRSESAISYT